MYVIEAKKKKVKKFKNRSFKKRNDKTKNNFIKRRSYRRKLVNIPILMTKSNGRYKESQKS